MESHDEAGQKTARAASDAADDLSSATRDCGVIAQSYAPSPNARRRSTRCDVPHAYMESNTHNSNCPSWPRCFWRSRVVNRPATGVITRCPEEPYVNSTSTVPREGPLGDWGSLLDRKAATGGGIQESCVWATVPRVATRSTKSSKLDEVH